MIEIRAKGTGKVMRFPEGTPMGVIKQQMKLQGDQFTGRDFTRHALAGATFDMGDELGATAYGLMNKFLPGGEGEFWNARDQYLASEREEMAINRQMHPGKTIGSELLGGFGTGVAGGLKAGGTQAGKQLANFARQGMRNRIGVGASSAAVGGGLQGAGSSDSTDFAELAGDTAKGMAMGGAFGTLMEPVVSSAQRVGRALTSVPQKQHRRIKRGLIHGEMTPKQAERMLEKFGPDTMLADIEDNLTAELERIANMPGKGRKMATSRLMRRNRQQIGKLLDAAAAKGTYHETLDKLKTRKLTVGNQKYNDAMAAGIKHTRGLEDLHRGLRQVYPEFWADAQRIGKGEFLASGAAMPNLGKAPRLTLAGWDQVKKALWDKAEALRGSTRTGASKEARNLDGIRQRLVGMLDDQNGLYKEAREYWGGLETFQKMMEDGRKFVTKSLSASDFRYMWGSLDEMERLAYMEGARQSMQDILEKAGFTHDLTRMFDNPQFRHKWMTMFGKEQRKEGAKFLRMLHSEARKHSTLRQALGNSQTAYRQELQKLDQLPAETLAALADFFVYGSPVSAAGAMARRMSGRVVQPRGSGREMMADMLTETDPAKINETIRRAFQPGGYGGKARGIAGIPGSPVLPMMGGAAASAAGEDRP